MGRSLMIELGAEHIFQEQLVTGPEVSLGHFGALELTDAVEIDLAAASIT